MNNKTINPELVLAGARMAYPRYKWLLGSDGEVYYTIPPPSKVFAKVFKPHGYGASDSDFRYLERALKEDFVFGWLARIDELDGSGFYASYYSEKTKRREQISDKSDTLLLLKCVSAMTGLPLYLEDKQ